MTLSEFMEARGLTDETLAVLVREDGTGCDRSTINRLRNGKGWPSRKVAARLKVVSGGEVSLDSLMQDFDPAEARP